MAKTQKPQAKNRPPLWQVIFASIGIVMSAILLFNLFVANIKSKSKPFHFQSDLPSEDINLTETLSALAGSPVYQGGEIKILENGDFYPALFKDLTDAKTSIEMTQYIWENGNVSDQLFSILSQKANEGIGVRLILDAFGAKQIDKEKLSDLQKAGAEVVWFHPLKPGLLTKFNKRNHARAIVIDNNLGYTGGEAVADYWSGEAEDKDHWRDLMFRLTGPVMYSVQNTFAGLWQTTSGEVLKYEPRKSSQEGILSVGITNRAPDQDLTLLSAFLATGIQSAQKTLYIETPYLILESRIKDELIKAHKRGVDVRLILPGKYIDTKIVQSASQYYYRGLLENGIRIYEYNPTMLHAKFMVADGVWSVIGSANIDTRSSFYNIENNIGIQDQKFGQSLQEIFSIDLAKSTEITLEDWQRRSFIRKALEPFSTLVDKQL